MRNGSDITVKQPEIVTCMLLCITCIAAWDIRCATSCAAKGNFRPRAGRIQLRAFASSAPKNSVLPAVGTDFKQKMQKQKAEK